MFVLIGIAIVLAGVLGGFALEGGPFLVLMQVAEFLIIGGAALGAVFISTPITIQKKIVQKLIGALKGSKVSKEQYLNLLKLLFELFQIAQKDGVIALESHIETPEKSAIFTKYPDIANDDHLRLFIADTLRLILIGGISPHDLESLMERDIETHHKAGTIPGMILQKVGDSMPGIGIVAAVLGIIITMQAINGPPEEIGNKVAAALVGTFLGILLSYGFIQPLATNIDLANDEESRVFEVIKSAIVCSSKGFNPIISVEFARRTIASDHRPTFQEMENMVKERK
jgi:chemotaxis protein MotA